MSPGGGGDGDDEIEDREGEWESNGTEAWGLSDATAEKCKKVYPNYESARKAPPPSYPPYHFSEFRCWQPTNLFVSAFTIKIGEDHDAGGCSPDVTPISGFDL